jgi:hypothetical protein
MFSDDACQSTESVGVPLYSTPSTTGAAIGAVYKRNHPEYGCGLLFKRAETSFEEELPSDESGYEISAAVVYERRGRWFASLFTAPPGLNMRTQRFPRVSILLSGRMAYLRNDWDGQLRENPAWGSRLRLCQLNGHIPKRIGIDVLGMTESVTTTGFMYDLQPRRAETQPSRCRQCKAGSQPIGRMGRLQRGLFKGLLSRHRRINADGSKPGLLEDLRRAAPGR